MPNGSGRLRATLEQARVRKPTEPAPLRETDARLLARTAEGDLTALGLLYDRYHRDVRRTLARAAQPADVDDMVQATFVALPKIARSYDGRDTARAWICGIAVRLESRRRRSAARLFATLGRFARTLTLGFDEEERLSALGDLRKLDAALAHLDPRKRDVFVLVEIEGLPVERVSELLGIPPPTVRTRLFHARAELRQALGR